MLDAAGVLFLTLLHLFVIVITAIWVVTAIKEDRKQCKCDCKEGKVENLPNL
jgi:hypothetical protein